MTLTPRLYVGDATSGAIYLFGSTTLDVAQAYQIRARTARVAPAGAGGECIFTTAYLVVTHDLVTDDVTITVTPILDGVEQTGEALNIVLAVQTPAGRVTEVFEIGLSLPNVFNPGAADHGRYAMRGTWFQLLITSNDALDSGDGEIILEAVELEYEVVRESKAAVVESGS